MMALISRHIVRHGTVCTEINSIPWTKPAEHSCGAVRMLLHANGVRMTRIILSYYGDVWMANSKAQCYRTVRCLFLWYATRGLCDPGLTVCCLSETQQPGQNIGCLHEREDLLWQRIAAKCKLCFLGNTARPSCSHQPCKYSRTSIIRTGTRDSSDNR